MYMTHFTSYTLLRFFILNSLFPLAFLSAKYSNIPLEDKCFNKNEEEISCCDQNQCLTLCTPLCKCGCSTMCREPDVIEPSDDDKCLPDEPSSDLGLGKKCYDKCEQHNTLESGQFRQVYVGAEKVDWATAKKKCAECGMRLMSHEYPDKDSFFNSALKAYSLDFTNASSIDPGLWYVWTSGKTDPDRSRAPRKGWEPFVWDTTGCQFFLQARANEPVFKNHCVSLETFKDENTKHPWKIKHFFRVLTCDERLYYMCEAMECRTSSRDSFLLNKEKHSCFAG